MKHIRWQFRIPTRLSDIGFLLIPVRVQIDSLVRRALNLRAGHASRAALQLALVWLKQDGLQLATNDDPALKKPICDLTEREARRVVRLCRSRLREFVSAYSSIDTRAVARSSAGLNG